MMKKRLAVICAISGLSFLLLLVVRAGYIPRTFHRPPGHVATTVVDSSSGLRLASLFEGQPHDPRLALEHVQPRPIPCSKAESRAELPVLAGTTVHACGTCLPTDGCLGKNWMQGTAFCNTGGGCSGSYEFAQPDPFHASPEVGFMRDGTACGGCSECGCAEPTCPNGGGIH